MSLRYIFFYLALFLIVSIGTVSAQETQTPFINIVKTETFGLPIDCEVGNSCHIMKYVDMIADDNKMNDPACNALTTIGHKGTDFVIADEATMNEGVKILAALDGTVLRTRDGELDRWPTDKDIEDVKSQRKECGNAVLIDHGNELQTVYCHLKKGSIVVKKGQKVQKGEKLAEVGLSGLTELPHLHFGIIKNQKVIDPFTANDNTQKCGKNFRSLWDKELNLSYQPVAIQTVGFSNVLPSLESLSKDSYFPKTFKPDNDLLSLYIVYFGAKKGDEISLIIRDPNDDIFSKYTLTQDKTRTRQFYYTGKRLNDKPLKLGAYTGHVKITRTDDKGDQSIWEDYATILVEDTQ